MQGLLPAQRGGRWALWHLWGARSFSACALMGPDWGGSPPDYAPLHCPFPQTPLQRQAEALKMGIRAICYELKAPKEEVVDLILKNQSVLHGREMHLSVADIAHLAMLRQPVGRIVD